MQFLLGPLSQHSGWHGDEHENISDSDLSYCLNNVGPVIAKEKDIEHFLYPIISYDFGFVCVTCLLPISLGNMKKQNLKSWADKMNTLPAWFVSC